MFCIAWLTALAVSIPFVIVLATIAGAGIGALLGARRGTHWIALAAILPTIVILNWRIFYPFGDKIGNYFYSRIADPWESLLLGLALSLLGSLVLIRRDANRTGFKKYSVRFSERCEIAEL